MSADKATGWQPMEAAPRGPWSMRQLIQVYGNDRHDLNKRVMPGFMDGDRAMAMDDTGSYPFDAETWRPLAEPPA